MGNIERKLIDKTDVFYIDDYTRDGLIELITKYPSDTKFEIEEFQIRANWKVLETEEEAIKRVEQHKVKKAEKIKQLEEELRRLKKYETLS